MSNATMVRKCKHHGETIFAQNSHSGYWQCLKCATKRVNSSQRTLKERMVSEKDGHCQICGYHGYIGALEFHHIDPKTKSFEINSRCTKPWETILAEIEKCVMLCANCHREVHGGFAQLTDRRYKTWEKLEETML